MDYGTINAIAKKFGTPTEFGTFPSLYHFQQIGNPNVTGSFGAEKR